MFTRNEVRLMHEECVAALAGIAKKYKVEIKKAGGSFNSYDATLKFTMVKSDAEAKRERVKQETQEYMVYAEHFGLPRNSYGLSFISAGKTYKIVGLRYRAKRCPVVTERADGKKFAWPVDVVLKLLKQV